MRKPYKVLIPGARLLACTRVGHAKGLIETWWRDHRPNGPLFAGERIPILDGSRPNMPMVASYNGTWLDFEKEK